MLSTIDFYDQFSFKKHEINNVRSYGMLSSDFFGTELSVPKIAPKKSLGIGRFFSEDLSIRCQI